MSLPKPYLSKFFVLVRDMNKCQKMVPFHGILKVCYFSLSACQQCLLFGGGD